MKYFTFLLALVVCSMIIPAMPEPVGSVAHAGDCDDNCIVALAVCRKYCSSSESDCINKCDMYDDSSSNSRCRAKCSRERATCTDRCDFAFRLCRKVCE